MKDFYDLKLLADSFAFDGVTLVRALRATFERRGTELPIAPTVGLTQTFSQDRTKQTQWRAFLIKAGLTLDATLPDVVAGIAVFAGGPFEAAAAKTPFDKQWPARGPWEGATLSGDRRRAIAD